MVSLTPDVAQVTVGKVTVTHPWLSLLSLEGHQCPLTSSAAGDDRGAGGVVVSAGAGAGALGVIALGDGDGSGVSGAALGLVAGGLEGVDEAAGPVGVPAEQAERPTAATAAAIRGRLDRRGRDRPNMGLRIGPPPVGSPAISPVLVVAGSA